MKDLLIERVGRFALVPVVHHSYEFTLVAAQVFELLDPVAVAVEYPFAMQDLLLKAIKRLPRVSILMFGRETRSYIRIEPVDPFVEAVRLALEHDRQVRCIDLAVTNYPQIYEPVPDTYALNALGHKKYCQMILEAGLSRQTEQDEARENAMAYYLKSLEKQLGRRRSQHPVLVLCGLSHLNGLKEKLSSKQAQPFERPIPAKLYHLSSSSLGEIMGCFPFFTAVYERSRGSAASAEPENSPEPKVIGNFQILDGKKLDNLRDFAILAHRETAASGSTDRRELLAQYLLWCRNYYEQEIGDRINPQSVFLLDNFARKYANVKSMLLPDFYETLIAGRSCLGSHFCYRMWEIGTVYPAQEGPSELEIIELRASDIFPLVQKVRMNPNAPLRPRATLPRFLRRSEKQRKPNEDYRFQPFSICSYQPEDIVIEDYGRYLRKKGKNMLSEERKRVHPFETSLLDGVDLRETIRNWHSGKIYVQECMTIKGSVDSLVVIYDEKDENYPYTVTWLGEHNQESDMAFYATDPETRPIGPGIRKALYGGFLMTMPPGRLFDVFHDPAYRIATNYAERLLLAAIDYGLERFVIYSAPKPPRPFFQVIAGRYGKRILYVPLSQLSPVMLQKIRTFHILADKSVRDYAKDYIW